MSRRKYEAQLDALVAHLDSPGDSKLYSDGRRGESEIIAKSDGEHMPTHYERCVDAARERVRRSAPYLLDVFHLVVANGSNREESIGALASKRQIKVESARVIYCRHLGKLLMLFGEW